MLPTSRLCTATDTVKGVLAEILPKFVGNMNFDELMLSLDGMLPIGAGLHEPPASCRPFVRGWFVVAQKLI